MTGRVKARSRTEPRVVFTAATLPQWERVKLPEWLFAFALVLAPMAIGSVHVVTQLVLATVLVVAFGLVALELNRHGRKVRVGLFGIALMVALGWTLLQCIPLPIGWVETLSPLSASSRLEAARLAGLDAPGWVPLSLDAGRTAESLLTLVALLAGYLIATSLRLDAHARHRLVIYLELAALMVLGSGLLHEGLQLTSIWGFYETSMPNFGGQPFMSALVNPNHAAAIMLVGALVAFSASLSPEHSQRWHLAVGIALAAGVLATMSRANGALLLIGLLALTVPPLLSKRHKGRKKGVLRLMIGVLACLFVATVLIGPERWLSEFASLGKGDFGATILTDVWSVGAGAAMHAPLSGVGNGAFFAVAPLYSPEVDVGFVAYAHHGVLQVLADLGLVVGSAVLVLTVVGFLRALFKSFGNLSSWGMALALLMIALQNLVDFSLWIPSVGLVAATTMGLLDHTTWPVERGGTKMAPAWRWPAWASGVLAGVLVVAARPALVGSPLLARDTMRAALHDVTPDAVDRGRLALDHPHDYQVQLLAAALAQASQQPEEARARTELALKTAPSSPMTLAAAARLRLNQGDVDGAWPLIERLDPRHVGQRRALEIVLGAPWAKPLHERFFEGHPARAVQGALMLRALKRPKEADALLEWALARAPRSLVLHEQLGLARFSEAAFLSKLASSCLSLAGLSEDTERTQWERLGYLFQARVEYLENRDMRAWHLYLSAADADPATAQVPLLEAGRVADRAGRLDLLQEAVDKLTALDASHPITGEWGRGEYYLWRSRARELADDVPGAIREMHQVVRHLGSVPRFHDRLAALFERVNDREAAARARERARTLAGQTP